jgi:isopentenyl phosphate kinase
MKNKKPITLIKLGGSVITNKDIPMSMKNGFLASLAKQVMRAMEENPDEQFVVGHGSGSFAHVPASKYKTIDGFIDEESVLGMAIVQDAAAQLNRKVVYEFIKNDVPAVTFAPSNTLVTNDRQERANFFSLLEMYLDRGLFPVTYGDVIVDTKQGCTIWSTEKVLAFFTELFLEEGYQVDSVVHVTEVAGFLDANKAVVPKINKENWFELKKNLGATKGFDVTGGMTLKIEESLLLAEKGVKSVILSGVKQDNLYNYLTDKEWIGTEIS